jgi:hypothetical protein
MGQLLGSPEPGESLAHMVIHPGDLSSVALLEIMAKAESAGPPSARHDLRHSSSSAAGGVALGERLYRPRHIREVYQVAEEDAREAVVLSRDARERLPHARLSGFEFGLKWLQDWQLMP